MSESTIGNRQLASPTHQSKIAYLDGLRGYAALVVAWTHFKELVLPGEPLMVHFQYEQWLHHSPIALIFSSKLAVLLFFVHSGLVLSWKYLATYDRRILVSMSLRRVFRLGIPVAASIIFAFALMRLGLMHVAEASQITGATPWAEAYRFDPTLRTLLTDVFGGALLYSTVRYNGALWTMSIELICSYGVFLLLPLIAKLRTEQIILAFAIASLSLLQHYQWMVCFLSGVVLARLYQEGWFSLDGEIYRLFSSFRFLQPFLLVIAAVFTLYSDWSGIHLPVPQFLNPTEMVQIASAVIMVVLVLSSPLAQSFFGNRVSRHIGKLSFSVYLVHLPIICSFSSWMIIRLAGMGTGYGMMVLITFVATMLMLYLAALLMTVFIDRLAINFGKKFLEKRLYAEGGNPQSAAPKQVEYARP
ncbi:MAG: acyltransferase family protein [Blastocatellales bacterium]